MRIAPTVGARVGHAAAMAEARGARPGPRRTRRAARRDAVASYQPYWALRAHLLAALGRADDAAVAYARAIELSTDGAVRAFLGAQEGAGRKFYSG